MKLITFLVNEEELKDLPFVVYFNFENAHAALTPLLVRTISSNPIFHVCVLIIIMCSN